MGRLCLSCAPGALLGADAEDGEGLTLLEAAVLGG